jgi:site-specific DNA-methyltransferase (adenine-specific)
MKNMIDDNLKVDCILTSPFYNTNKKSSKNVRLTHEMNNSGSFPYCRYDIHVDDLTNDEYTNYTIKLFNYYDRILKTNGCILYNLSYGSENTTGMYEAIYGVLKNTPFCIVDTIVWKKEKACPNNMSPNRLTRIIEFIFVFARKSEAKTFNANKQVVSVRSTGQKNYENIYNFFEAKNNDETCTYNKATFSSELCLKLFEIYLKKDSNVVVYDSFMGTGTTAVAAIKYGIKYIGSEISKDQCEWAKNRIEVLL